MIHPTQNLILGRPPQFGDREQIEYIHEYERAKFFEFDDEELFDEITELAEIRCPEYRKYYNAYMDGSILAIRRVLTRNTDWLTDHDIYVEGINDRDWDIYLRASNRDPEEEA